MNTAAEDPRARRRERLLGWGPTLLALAVSVVVTLRAHAHFLLPYATPVSNDEGYISALGLRMIRGHWLPYVDGVSQRGPITYWLAALAMRLGGMWSWIPIRVLALLCALSTLALVFLLALELFSPAAAAIAVLVSTYFAIAVLVSTYFFTYELNPWDGIGYNGEVVAMIFALASWLLVARAMRPADDPRGTVRRRDAHILVAGVLAACAGLSKQMALVHALPLAAWIVLGNNDPDSTRESRARALIRFALGSAIPFVVVVVIYAASGHLKEFFYYFQRYGREIFMAPVNYTSYRDKLREQLDKYLFGIVVVGSLGWLLAARVLRRVTDHEGPRWTGLRSQGGALVAFLQLVGSVIGASFTGRFFPHYLVEVFSVAAVVAGGALAASVAPSRATLRGRFVGTLTLVLGASALLVCSAPRRCWSSAPRTSAATCACAERPTAGTRTPTPTRSSATCWSAPTRGSASSSGASARRPTSRRSGCPPRASSTRSTPPGWCRGSRRRATRRSAGWCRAAGSSSLPTSSESAPSSSSTPAAP